MKPSEKLVRNAAFVTAGIAVAASIFLIVLIAMAEFGIFFPRKIAITINAPSLSKTYSDEPIKSECYISNGKLAEGHNLEILYQSELENVGNVPNKVEFRIVDKTGADMTDRYDITLNTGTLTVTPVLLSVRTISASKNYDGTPLSNPAYVCEEGKLCDGHRIEVASCSEQLEIGGTENDIEFRVYDSSDRDVTDQYRIIVQKGRLSVTKIPISVSTPSESREYDGKALESDSIVIQTGELLDGHVLFPVNKNVIEGTGSLKNEVQFGIKDGEGNDVSKYYNVTSNYGNLSVKKRTIMISTGSAVKEYDKKPLEAGYEITSGSLCEGHSLYVISQPSIISAGSRGNNIVLGVKDSQGKDVTEFYNIKYTTGTLSITKKYLTITTESISKEYDGTQLGGEYTLSKGELCEGDRLYLKSADYLNRISTMQNIVTVGVEDENGKDVSENYTINYSYGVLSLFPRAITIKMADVEADYTGKSIYDDSYTVISGSLCEGHTMKVTGSRETNIGVFYNDMLSCKIVAVDEKGRTTDVTSYYRVSYLSGKITIKTGE